MTNDEQLLQQYSQGRSESAFGELVARHIDLVYSAALRMVNGDVHLAQDVTQTVFIGLTRKARSLPRDVVIAGWLYRHTCYTAMTTIRTERRRKIREQTAMEMSALDDNTEPPWKLIAPHLDEGLNQLNRSDRDALVLRFLKRQDLRAVGAALGISEDAAQKRVSRALDKLRDILNRRGTALTAAALTSILATKTVTAAPAGLAVGVTAASLAAATEAGTTLTFLKFMAATKLKTGIISAVVLATLATPLVLQHQAEARIRNQNEVLRQQTQRLDQLQPENARLSNVMAQATSTPGLSRDQLGELLRLRGEVGRLRVEVKKLTDLAAFRQKISQLPLDQVWPARVDRLKQWLEEHPSEKVPELAFLPARTWLNSTYPIPLETDEECRRAMSVVRANAEGPTQHNLAAALRQFANANGGQFPTELSQLTPYLNPLLDDQILGRYTILPASSLVSELALDGEKWVITEQAPVNAADDIRNAFGLTGVKSANQSVPNRWVSGN